MRNTVDILSPDHIVDFGASYNRLGEAFSKLCLDDVIENSRVLMGVADFETAKASLVYSIGNIIAKGGPNSILAAVTSISESLSSVADKPLNTNYSSNDLYGANDTADIDDLLPVSSSLLDSDFNIISKNTFLHLFSNVFNNSRRRLDQSIDSIIQKTAPFATIASSETLILRSVQEIASSRLDGNVDLGILEKLVRAVSHNVGNVLGDSLNLFPNGIIDSDTILTAINLIDSSVATNASNHNLKPEVDLLQSVRNLLGSSGKSSARYISDIVLKSAVLLSRTPAFLHLNEAVKQDFFACSEAFIGQSKLYSEFVNKNKSKKDILNHIFRLESLENKDRVFLTNLIHEKGLSCNPQVTRFDKKISGFVLSNSHLSSTRQHNLSADGWSEEELEIKAYLEQIVELTMESFKIPLKVDVDGIDHCTQLLAINSAKIRQGVESLKSYVGYGVRNGSKFGPRTVFSDDSVLDCLDSIALRLASIYPVPQLCKRYADGSVAVTPEWMRSMKAITHNRINDRVMSQIANVLLDNIVDPNSDHAALTRDLNKLCRGDKVIMNLLLSEFDKNSKLFFGVKEVGNASLFRDLVASAADQVFSTLSKKDLDNVNKCAIGKHNSLLSDLHRKQHVSVGQNEILSSVMMFGDDPGVERILSQIVGQEEQSYSSLTYYNNPSPVNSSKGVKLRDAGDVTHAIINAAKTAAIGTAVVLAADTIDNIFDSANGLLGNLSTFFQASTDSGITMPSVFMSVWPEAKKLIDDGDITAAAKLIRDAAIGEGSILGFPFSTHILVWMIYDLMGGDSAKNLQSILNDVSSILAQGIVTGLFRFLAGANYATMALTMISTAFSIYFRHKQAKQMKDLSGKVHLLNYDQQAINKRLLDIEKQLKSTAVRFDPNNITSFSLPLKMQPYGRFNAFNFDKKLLRGFGMRAWQIEHLEMIQSMPEGAREMFFNRFLMSYLASGFAERSLHLTSGLFYGSSVRAGRLAAQYCGSKMNSSTKKVDIAAWVQTSEGNPNRFVFQDPVNNESETLYLKDASDLPSFDQAMKHLNLRDRISHGFGSAFKTVGRGIRSVFSKRSHGEHGVYHGLLEDKIRRNDRRIRSNMLDTSSCIADREAIGKFSGALSEFMDSYSTYIAFADTNRKVSQEMGEFACLCEVLQQMESGTSSANLVGDAASGLAAPLQPHLLKVLNNISDLSSVRDFTVGVNEVKRRMHCLRYSIACHFQNMCKICGVEMEFPSSSATVDVTLEMMTGLGNSIDKITDSLNSATINLEAAEDLCYSRGLQIVDQQTALRPDVSDFASNEHDDDAKVRDKIAADNSFVPSDIKSQRTLLHGNSVIPDNVPYPSAIVHDNGYKGARIVVSPVVNRLDSPSYRVISMLKSSNKQSKSKNSLMSRRHLQHSVARSLHNPPKPPDRHPLLQNTKLRGSSSSFNADQDLCFSYVN